jgi:hypothetical protein
VTVLKLKYPIDVPMTLRESVPLSKSLLAPPSTENLMLMIPAEAAADMATSATVARRSFFIPIFSRVESEVT